MIGTPPPIPGRNAASVAVFDGCSGCSDPQNSLPAGHSLSRARLRHFQQAAWIVVTEDSIPVGLAAYKRVDSDVRVVHEFLLDQTLGGRDTARVTDVLLSAVETMAYDDSVGCLMFLLGGDVVLAPFEQRGYTAVVIDPLARGCKRNSIVWVGRAYVRSVQTDDVDEGMLNVHVCGHPSRSASEGAAILVASGRIHTIACVSQKDCFFYLSVGRRFDVRWYPDTGACPD